MQPRPEAHRLTLLSLALGDSLGLPLEGLSLLRTAILPRNAVFLAVVLGHGFRRLLPPY